MYPLASIILFLVLIFILARLQRLTSTNKYKFYKGLKKEREGKIEIAKTIYLSFLKLPINDLHTDSLIYDALVRYSVIILKSNSTSEISNWIYKYLTVFIATKNNSRKDEVIFQYVLLLQKNKQYYEIQTLLTHHIWNKEEPSIKNLLLHSSSQIEKEINRIIDLINDNLDSPSQYLEIMELISQSDDVLIHMPKIKDDIEKIKPYLLNASLLNTEINISEHIRVFKFLISNEAISTNYNLLNNAAIIAARIASKKGLTEQNYKDIISIFLTAIFNDNVFLQKLYSAGWDDEYNINLYNSRGFLNEVLVPEHGLENISSTTDEHTIDIENTRNFLLREFESDLIRLKDSLGDGYPSIINFYENEKEYLNKAIVGFYDYVDREKNPIAFSPHFGYKYNLITNLFRDFSISPPPIQVLNSSIPYILRQLDIDIKEIEANKIVNLFENNTPSNVFYERAKTFLSSTFLASRIEQNDYDTIRNYPNRFKNALNDCNSEDVEIIERAMFTSELKENLSVSERIDRYQSVLNLLPKANKIRIKLSREISLDAVSKINTKTITSDNFYSLLLKALKLDRTNYNAQMNLIYVFESECVKWAANSLLENKVNEIATLFGEDSKNDLSKKLKLIFKDTKEYLLKEYNLIDMKSYRFAEEEFHRITNSKYKNLFNQFAQAIWVLNG